MQHAKSLLFNVIDRYTFVLKNSNSATTGKFSVIQFRLKGLSDGSNELFSTAEIVFSIFNFFEISKHLRLLQNFTIFAKRTIFEENYQSSCTPQQVCHFKKFSKASRFFYENICPFWKKDPSFKRQRSENVFTFQLFAWRVSQERRVVEEWADQVRGLEVPMY